jgi:hypothetical protein
MPRFLRPRLLLLPLLFGVLVAPAFLVSSTVSPAGESAHADSVCTNVARPVENPQPVAPSCANCRAPLLNAPLARADRKARSAPVELPPAA